MGLPVLTDSASRAVRTLADRRRVLAARGQEVPIALLTRYVFEHNAVCRLGFLHDRQWVRRLLRGVVGVASDRDEVRAVLADHESYACGYTSRLPGPFVLGLEDERHDQVRGELAFALRGPDIDPIVADTRAMATAAMAGRSSLDVGADLVHPVFDHTVTTYLGIAGSDGPTRWQWGRDIFEHIFLNFTDVPGVRANAEAATAQLTELIMRIIGERRTEPAADDVLGRLLAAQGSRPNALSDAEICVNLIGIAVGWWWHGARTALIALDEILAAGRLDAAREAARSSDTDALRRFVWEVLRFRPVQLGVVRTCTRDTRVGGERLRTGTAVLVGTQAAMWDGVADPDRFDADRDPATYLIFGAGVHRCMGEQIMGRQLPELLRPLLSVPGLARSGGMRWDGPRPDGFEVRW